MYFPLFLAVLFAIAKTWKQPKGLMMYEEFVVCVMEYY